MGIFSLFGKKDKQPAKPAEPTGAKRGSGSSRSGSARSTMPPVQPAKRDPKAARETALKIDAIESEMSSEFVTLPASRLRNADTRPMGPSTVMPPPSTTQLPTTQLPATQLPAAEPETTGMGSTTQMLLDGQTSVGVIATPSSDAGALIEEAAIMYANGQQTLVEQMLCGAVAEDALGESTAKAWLMLFDLYQICGKRNEFEQLAVAYANKFETSPPAWTAGDADPVDRETGATPAVPFTGMLDAGCVRQIERIQKLAENYRTLRLEFARVSAVDAAGCGPLLGALKKLQKSGHELVLVGAAELAVKIRATLETGRRDDSEDAWLLLMEILCLLNREQEFEEVSIDYCITFEVSPPAFVAPQNKIIAEAAAQPETEGFPLPRLIEGRIDDLIVAIAAYSDEHNPALIDCSQLVRIDFHAAGRLLTGLAPFCGAGKALEFHHVSHLVAELFNVIGLQDVAKIHTRRS